MHFNFTSVTTGLVLVVALFVSYALTMWVRAASQGSPIGVGGLFGPLISFRYWMLSIAVFIVGVCITNLFAR